MAENELISILERELSRRGVRSSEANIPFSEFVSKHITPTAQQKELICAIERGDKRIMVCAGHGVGKSAIAGLLAIWYLRQHDPALVLTTAPTAKQVSDVLWGEIRKHYRGPGMAPRAPLIRLGHNRQAIGITVSQPEALQGRHCPNTLVIIDEATGVPGEIWDACESIVAGGGIMVALTNPTDTSSRCKREWDSGRWTRLVWSCLDHPNITEDAGIPGAVTPEWVATMFEAWSHDGEDVVWAGKTWAATPVIQARVLGMWPSSDAGCVFAAAIAAMDAPKEAIGTKVVAVDPAGYGEDHTAIVVLIGDVLVEHELISESSLSGITAAVNAVIDKYGADVVVYDAVGLGHGLRDMLPNAVPYIGNQRAIDSRTYANRRAESYVNLSRRRIYVPDRYARQRLTEEMRAATLKIGSKLSLTEKADVRKHIGRSPDLLDALAMAADAATVKPWWAEL